MSAAAVVVTAPYGEGAIMNVARHLEEKGRLEALYMPSSRFTRMAGRAVAPIPRLRGLSQRLLRNRETSAVLREVAPTIELRRLAASVGRRRGMSSTLKRNFATATARDLQHRGTADRVTVGMPGACLEIFENVRGRRVFHEVDGHPRHLRETLRAAFGSRANDEIPSPAAIDRIEAELALADLVLVPSTVVADQLKTYSNTKDRRILRIPYGVDFSKFAPIANGGSTGGRRPRVLYVGQISYRKGISYLMEAARNARCDVVLAGPVVQPRLLESMPLNVNYVGPLSHEALNVEFNRADAFALVSVEENFGLVLAEAAAAGLPIVATPEVGAVEYLSHRDVSLVAYGVVPDLHAALNDVQPLEFESRMERAAEIRASGRFKSWDWYAHSVEAAIITDIDFL